MEGNTNLLLEKIDQHWKWSLAIFITTTLWLLNYFNILPFVKQTKLYESNLFYPVVLLFLLSLLTIVIKICHKANPLTRSYKHLKYAAPQIRKFLDENRRIFISVGPNSSAGQIGDIRTDPAVWETTKKNIILPNNDKILTLLEHVQNYKTTERDIVGRMKTHIHAFKEHCNNPHMDYTQHQFPMDFSDLIYKYSKNSSWRRRWLLNKITTWIRREILEEEINIQSIKFFGSALYIGKPSDIDILVKTSSIGLDTINCEALAWKHIQNRFTEKFNIKIDVKVFSGLEEQQFQDFLSKIPDSKEVDIHG
jgi:predicted nucleotidyltransferase